MTRRIDPLGDVAWLGMRASARVLAARRLNLVVTGAENVPPAGPVLIACRHEHHLDDGVALLAAVPRPLSILVALDWVANKWQRRAFEAACAWARWPVVLRGESFRQSGQPARAYAPDEVSRYVRLGFRRAIEVLGGGRALVVFPEGYPNVDPSFTLKRGPEDFLPFRDGLVRLAEHVARRTGATCPIVPAGIQTVAGQRRRVTLRFGPPVDVPAPADRAALLSRVESAVRELSRPRCPDAADSVP